MTRLREVLRIEQKDRACVLALVLLTVIPLLPEYCAPVLAMGSLVAACRDARLRRDALRIGTIGKLLLLYIAYMAVGMLYSAHPLNSASTVLMWLVMFAGYLTVTTVVFNRRRLEIALLLLSLVAGMVGFIACCQYILRDLLGVPLPNQLWFSLDSLVYRYFPLNINLMLGEHRAAATFNNPNVLGEFLVMVLPLTIYYGFGGRRTTLHLIGRACVLLSLMGIAVSFSRGAYLALLSMLLLIIVTNLRRITPLILSLVAAASLVPEVVISRFLAIGNSTDVSISERFVAWDVTVQAIIQQPFVGLGPGVSNLWELLQNAGSSAPHSHNLILQVLVEGGFVALFLLALVATRLLQSSVELMGHSPKTHFLGVSFMIFGVAFVVYGMVDYPFLCPKLIGTFLMILGFAESCFSLYLQQECVPLRRLIRLPAGKPQRKQKI
ncbi:MAG: O-antigen ligase family protein [Clostridia bacterium]|nr:O-antigen ligase family protein [Clostridia bacterium]